MMDFDICAVRHSLGRILLSLGSRAVYLIAGHGGPAVTQWHARYQQPDVKEKTKLITKDKKRTGEKRKKRKKIPPSRGDAGDGFLRVLHLPVSHTGDSTVVGIPRKKGPPDGPEP